MRVSAEGDDRQDWQSDAFDISYSDTFDGPPALCHQQLSASESVEASQVTDRADIDISGPEFNFVRSIRVFDVRYVRQHAAGQETECNRVEAVFLGSYGLQGAFSWERSSVAALPPAHVGLEGWGESCPEIHHRSVFVDWRDYSGTYGFEQVNY